MSFVSQDHGPDFARDIEAAKALAQAATDGPWVAHTPHPAADSWIEGARILGMRSQVALGISDPRDAAFIAGARDAVPMMADGLLRVLNLHCAVPVYEFIEDCPDHDEHETVFDSRGDAMCGASPTGDLACGECSEDRDEPVAHPCLTVRSLLGEV